MNIGTVNKKRLVIRLGLLSVVVAIGFLLFYLGKEHEILLDNKTAEIKGIKYQAAQYVKITINGDEKNSIELYSDERDVVKLSGPDHSVKVEIIDENTEKVVKSAEKDFNFGRTSSLMISIPAVAENAPDVYLPLPGAMAPQASAPKSDIPAAEAEDVPEEGAEIEAPALSD